VIRSSDAYSHITLMGHHGPWQLASGLPVSSGSSEVWFVSRLVGLLLSGTTASAVLGCVVSSERVGMHTVVIFWQLSGVCRFGNTR